MKITVRHNKTEITIEHDNSFGSTSVIEIVKTCAAQVKELIKETE